MPIEHGYPVTSPERRSIDGHGTASRAGSEEAEGSALQHAVFNPYFTGRPRTPTRHESMDRQEIIRRIKRREGPRPVTPPERVDTVSFARKRKSPSPPTLLPAPELTGDQPVEPDSPAWTANGLAISRPGSALHKGDFREEQASQWQRERPTRPLHLDGQRDPQRHQPAISTSPVAPWHPAFPQPRSVRPHAVSEQHVLPSRARPADFARPRAFSQASLSGSFTYQPPTSPLVHQANAADIPDHDVFFQRPSHSPDRSRRHTFSPRSLQSIGNHFADRTQGHYSRTPPSLHRESTYPYQAHQPRRSVTAASSVPQSPLLGSRRPSISGGSPLQHSMVGSFEESILRGRMSTTPSRPLDFTAQIGVLGLGDCKPSLKCPPHVTIPFPAVYYSYGSNLSVVDSQPSPYVGLVDLENSPQTGRSQEDKKARRRLKRVAGSRASSQDSNQSGPSDRAMDRRMKHKQQRRSHSPLGIPKGAYRIPPKGQMQIVIKNPHKNAVKLFLVPYDVSDIQPGQKTFIRQRSYSAGPIIDMPLDSRRNLGTDRPEAALCPTDDPSDKPVLRYLVHLHICCTSKGRIYLYKSMRVVFANRVPDGKEKLRNETQLPEPKYSAYKPERASSFGLASESTSDLSRRRQSMYGDLGRGDLDSDWPSAAGLFPVMMDASENVFGHRQTTPSFRLPQLATLDSRPPSRGATELADSHKISARQEEALLSPNSPQSPLSAERSSDSNGSLDGSSFTFSRSNSRERPARVKTESLLSRRLRDLEMHGRTDLDRQ